MQPIWRILNNPVKSLSLWGLLVLSILSLSWLQYGDDPAPWFAERLSTDLIGLLPATEQDRGGEEASNRFSQDFSNRVVFLVSSASRIQARTAAVQLDSLLNSNNNFKQLLTSIDKDSWQNIVAFYFPYRYSLLSQSERTLSSDQLADKLINRAVSRLASPVGLTSSRQLIEDPLFQLPRWFEALSGASGNLRQDDGLLVIEQNDQYYVMISGLLNGNAMSLTSQDNLVSFINTSINTVTSGLPDTQVIASGMIFHAKAGADSARQEVSTIGVGSVMGIILLMLVIFRTMTPLFLCLLSIGTGVLVGYLVTLLTFGQVHVMTLVFGASLTGVSIDYAFHYMSEWLRQGKQWSPISGLKHIFPGITLGLITSLLGYIPMLATPFPGLQQMAVFSSAGLFAAWLTVVLVYPALLKKSGNVERNKIWLLPFVDFILNIWTNQISGIRRKGLLLCILPLTTGVFWLQSNDDIRQLQSRSSALVEAEASMKNITGRQIDNRFFLVSGSSAEAMLQNNELLAKALTLQVDQGLLKGFQSLSTFLSSQSAQLNTYQVLNEVLLNRMPAFWLKVGLPDSGRDQAMKMFEDSRGQIMMPEDWLQSSAADLYGYLWLGETEGRFYSAVLLEGAASDWEAGRLTDIAGVQFIDKTGSTSSLFKRYRVLMSWLLMVAYMVIAAILSLRYGMKGAVKVIIPPALSVLLTLSFLAVLGSSINLFHILALIMVLGIGIDYTLFFYEAGNERRFTFLAVTLSAITTILSFGLLTLSATDAIHGFGLTVLTGITFCYLLSPFAIRNTDHETT